MKILNKLRKELKENMETKIQISVEINKKIEKLDRIEEEVKTNVFLQNIINELGKTEDGIIENKRKKGTAVQGRHWVDFCLLSDLYEKKSLLLKLLFGE